MMIKNPYESFVQAQTDQELLEVQSMVNTGGYSSFRLLLDTLTEKIKAYEDGEIEHVAALIDKGKKLFPKPVLFSPSWEVVWQTLEQTVGYKASVLKSIPARERDGEWQVIMDNPFAIQEVVCYPGLPFLQAVYLYAYFRPQLERNEYIRLQKIQTLVMDFGN
jgi:hypothetical protein